MEFSSLAPKKIEQGKIYVSIQNSNKMGKPFVRGKEKYSLVEKKELASKLVEKHKKEYDKVVKALQGKIHYTYKRKKHVPIKPKQGFLSTAVWEFYSDLADVKRDDNNLNKAIKFAKRCYEKYLNDEFVDEEPPKKRFCERGGGGRKCKAPKVREAIFQWFINVQGVLKGRLPIKIFRSNKKYAIKKKIE